MHLIDLVGGALIPIVLFLALLTMPKWGPRICQAFLAVWDRYVVRPIGSEPDRPGSRAGSGDLVPAQQNQENQEPVRNFDRALAYFTQHKLTPDEAIDILSVLQLEDDYLLSANKIRDVVGGADAVVKARVATHRPKPPAPKRPARLERPANGW